MSLLKKYPAREGESSADYSYRLYRVVAKAKPAEKREYEEEILSLLEKPGHSDIGIDLIGRLGLSQAAKDIYKRLQSSGFPASEYSKCISALGQLEYKPAASTIQSFFQGRTRNAATIALFLIEPSRSEAPFLWYAKHHPAEGAVVAGIALSEYYEKHGTESLEKHLKFIPESLLTNVPEKAKLPRKLKLYVQAYVRRT